MNTPLQPELRHPDAGLDPHLDADQLSAFLEGALPEPERLSALRHMTACAHCREVIFLAQAADPALATQPATERAPRIWFAGSFVLLWTSALACCVLAVVLFQLHARSKPQQNPNIAAVHPAAEPPRVQPQPAEVPSPLSTPQKPVTAPTRSRRHAASVATPPPPPAAGAIPPVGLQALNLQTNNFLQTTPAPAAAAGSTRAKALAQNAPLQAYAGIAAAAPSPAGVPSGGAATRVPQPPATVEASADTAATAAAIDANASGVPLPLAAGSATIATLPPAAETVEVRSTQTVDLSASNITSVNASESAAHRKTDPDPLPSGLSSITSIAAEPRFHLELDTAGHLYWSRKGKHWKLIHPRWPGAIQTLKTADSGVLQLTTTTGALWSSTDGRHWTPAP